MRKLNVYQILLIVSVVAVIGSGLVNRKLLAGAEPRVSPAQAVIQVDGVEGPPSISVVLKSAIAIGSFQVTIGYDRNVLRLDGANVRGGTGEGFTERPLVVNIRDAAGQVIINAFQTGRAPTGTFSVANLTFTPVAVGTSALTLSGVTVTDTAGNDLPPEQASLSAKSIKVTQVP